MDDSYQLNAYLIDVLDQLSLHVTSASCGVLLGQDHLSLAAHRSGLEKVDLAAVFTDPPLVDYLTEYLMKGSALALSNTAIDGVNPGIVELQSSTPGYDHPWLCLPIQLNKRTLGYLALVKRRGDPFTANDVRIIGSYAQVMAVPVENDRCYLEAKQRAEEGQALLRVHRALTSRLELDPVLQLIADEARRLTNTRKSIMFLIQGDYLRTVALSGKHSKYVYVGYDIPLTNSITGSSIIQNRPVRIENADDNPSVFRNEHLQVHSFISVPLISESKAIGAIMVADKISGTLGDDDERIAWMLASSAVIAVENARHYQQEQDRRLEADQRRRVAEGLREILTILNSHCPLPEMLYHIARQACQFLGSDASAIAQLQDGEQSLIIQASFGLPEGLPANPYPFKSRLGLESIILKGKPDIVHAHSGTIRSDELPGGEGNDNYRLIFPNSEYHTTVAIPLIVDGGAYGEMLLFYREDRQFTDEEIGMAVVVGDQTALAIENAKLHEQAEDLARLQERQRIAQALHDSVAQMLFSLGMEVDKVLNNPAVDPSLEQPLQTIRRMTARSSHELRSAIFALREAKGSTGTSGVVDLVEDLVAEFRMQSGIAITCITPRKVPNLQPVVTEAIYRIVRESLSNISKHSNATAVIVNLSCDERTIHVMIQDDGVGLNQPQNFTDDEERRLHFGVATMHQIATQAHGEFKIMNGDDMGVLIKARFPIL